MKTLKPFICAVGLLLPAKMMFAQQVDPKISKSYSQDVVLRVYSVVSKIDLPTDKQVQLANYFKANDDAMAAAMTSGKPANTIDSLRRVATGGLVNVLTPEQFAKYSTPDAAGTGTGRGRGRGGFGGGRIGSILANAQQYHLSKAQTDSLSAVLVQMAKLRTTARASNTGSRANTTGLESAALNRILTSDQYNTYLVSKNTATATTWATGDWGEIKKRGLDKGLDSATTVKQIINYDANLLAVRERYKGDPEEATHEKAVTDNIPAVSKELKASKEHANPTGTNASTVKTGYAW